MFVFVCVFCFCCRLCLQFQVLRRRSDWLVKKLMHAVMKYVDPQASVSENILAQLHCACDGTILFNWIHPGLASCSELRDASLLLYCMRSARVCPTSCGGSWYVHVGSRSSPRPHPTPGARIYWCSEITLGKKLKKIIMLLYTISKPVAAEKSSKPIQSMVVAHKIDFCGRNMGSGKSPEQLSCIYLGPLAWEKKRRI